MSASQAEFDIVIVGGGLVGACLALSLRDAGFTIALIEAQRPKTYDPSGEYGLRVSAIAPSSRRLLQEIGIWKTITTHRVSPFRYMRVWDAEGHGSINFDADALGLPELGYIIENSNILSAAWQALGRVELFCPGRLAGLEITGDKATAELEDGRRLSARLLVGADGPGSQTRTLAGITTTGWGYAQRGLVATVATEQPHQQTAWQRFLPTGPLAFLPLADGRCSIVWSADEPLAQELLELDDADFCRCLGEAFGHKLGKITAAGPRASFPLRLQHATEYVQPRLALMGDAAHVVHPLAGQGVNLGLTDAQTLTDTLVRARDAERDIGSLAVLRRYARPRKSENIAMMAATDGLYRLFGTSNALVSLIRSAGLNLVDTLEPLKELFTRHAMGAQQHNSHAKESG